MTSTTKPSLVQRDLMLKNPSFYDCFSSLLSDTGVEELGKIKVLKLLVLNNLTCLPDLPLLVDFDISRFCNSPHTVLKRKAAPD